MSPSPVTTAWRELLVLDSRAGQGASPRAEVFLKGNWPIQGEKERSHGVGEAQRKDEDEEGLLGYMEGNGRLVNCV